MNNKLDSSGTTFRNCLVVADSSILKTGFWPRAGVIPSLTTVFRSDPEFSWRNRFTLPCSSTIRPNILLLFFYFLVFVRYRYTWCCITAKVLVVYESYKLPKICYIHWLVCWFSIRRFSGFLSNVAYFMQAVWWIRKKRVCLRYSWPQRLRNSLIFWWETGWGSQTEIQDHERSIHFPSIFHSLLAGGYSTSWEKQGDVFFDDVT